MTADRALVLVDGKHVPFVELGGLLVPFTTARNIAAAAWRNVVARRTAAQGLVGAVVYVSKAGSDGNSGASSDATVLTIAQANFLAQNNPQVTTICPLDTGVYGELVTVPRAGLTYDLTRGAIIDGNSKARSAIFTAYANTAVLGGELRNANYALWALKPGGSDLAGIVATGVYVHDVNRGIYLDGCDHPVMTGCIGGGTSVGGSVLGEMFSVWRGSNGGLISGCEASKAKARGIYVYQQPGGLVVRDFYVHDATDWTVSNYGVEAEGGSTGIVFLRGWVTACNLGVIVKTTDGGRMGGLVSWGNRLSGLYWKGASNGLCYNSDSYGNGSGLDVLWDDTSTVGSSNIKSRNNIISGSVDRDSGVNTGYAVRIDNIGAGNTFDYQDYYNNPNGFKNNSTSTVYTLAQWKALGKDTNSLAVNPSYVSSVYGGFALPGGSALLGAGTDTGQSLTRPNMGHTGSDWNLTAAPFYVLGIGDGKLLGDGNGGVSWLDYLLTDITATGREGLEMPQRIATEGATVHDVALAIDDALAAALGTPSSVVLNIGSADLPELPDEGDWKSDYGYILDALQVQWPDVPIFVTIPWQAGYDDNADTLAGWLADVLSAGGIGLGFPDVVVGSDERITLQRDGVINPLPTRMYNDDAPNTAGHTALGGRYLTALGFTAGPTTADAQFSGGSSNASTSSGGVEAGGSFTAWSAGATDATAITADGYVEASDANHLDVWAFGLSDSITLAGYVGLLYGLMINGGNVQVYESGEQVGVDVSAYADSDLLRVDVRDGMARYYQNGDLLYTSTALVTVTPLYLNVAISTPHAEIENVLVSLG